MKFRHLIFGSALVLASITVANAQNFQKYPSGLEYHFSNKGDGTYQGKTGDIATMHLVFTMGDSTMIDSRKMNNGLPFDQPINNPMYEGDVFEGISQMKKGDKAKFRILAKDFFERNKQPMPEWIKPTDYAAWTIEMVDVKSKEQADLDAANKAAAQLGIDEKIILEHLKSKGIQVAALPKTGNVTPNPKVAYKDEASGLYYIVLKKGKGAKGENGKKASVNYTGSLLDGTVFDSNVDPQFNHVQPIEFTVGTGQMIKGWDKMVPLMNSGDKVIAILPSPLAYGPQARPPHIPANGILQFEMELLDPAVIAKAQADAEEKAKAQVKIQAAADEKIILDYLKKNKIKVALVPKSGVLKANPKVAYKDVSGLYYIVNKVGTGTKAANDKNVSMNYTGSLLDGTVFDSNVDPKFNHVDPIKFVVGKGQMIKGWDKMAPNMKVGHKVTAILPSGLAYGPQARPPHIPANGILKFDMELLSVE